MSAQKHSSSVIKNFTEFLEKSLGKTVLEYSLKPLTKPGDNYGSVMQSLEVKVADTKDCSKSDVLHLVTKTAITNLFLAEIFKPDLSFVKENHFYSDIIPAIELFERSANVPKNERIDMFIRSLGSRNSLDPDAERADADAILLFENIKLLNYKNIDRHTGFNTHETLTIIKQLAKFHSVCIAIRRLQPDLFNSKISPFLDALTFTEVPKDTRVIENVCNDLRMIDDLDTKLCDDIVKQLRILNNTPRIKRVSDTPYTTVVHNDLWVNNIMLRYDGIAGNCIKTKIYDLQTYFYESIAYDLIFFLCTSVRSDDLVNSFQMFIKYYHTEFVNMLKLVNCPLDDYTFEKIYREIQEKSKAVLLQIILMTKIVLMEHNTTLSLDEITPEIFLNEDSVSKATLNRWKLIANMFRDHGFI